MKYADITRVATRLFAVAVSALALSAMAVTGAQAQHFKGKTIKIVVGYPAGGGTDLQARMIAEPLSNSIAGNPNVVVENMPGGGGSKALNFLYENADPDGMTVVWCPVSIQSQLMGDPGVRFDYANMTVLGATEAPALIAFARTDVVPGGLKSPEDIIKAEKLVFGGLRPTAWFDMSVMPALEMLGVEARYVPGYRGSQKVRAAILNGEINIAASTTIDFATTQKTLGDKITPLWYYSPVGEDGEFMKSEQAGDTPRFIDVYRKVHGKDPSGELWDAFAFWFKTTAPFSRVLLGPPGMDEAVANEIRDGYAKAVADPAFQKQSQKVLGYMMTSNSPQATSQEYKDAKGSDPKYIEFWKEYTTNMAK